HLRRGNAAEATLTYDRLRCLLRDELGTVPSPRVSALHEQLLRTGRGPGGPADPPSGAPRGQGDAGAAVPLPVIGGVAAGTRFVGREAHLERLREPWLEANAGERRFSLLVGEPGVGKTRLAAQFAAEVHRAGATVLYGRCDEEPLLAYQPFVQALRHYLHFGDWGADPASGPDLRELARLLPEGRSESRADGDAFAPDPESERFLLFEAVTRLVGRACRVRPLLLILDDLHWADKPTLLLLRHMMRLTDRARLMVLGVFRDVDVNADHPLVELVADLRWERRVERHALEGLDEAETDALVAERLEAQATPGFVRGLRTQTEGNPFFIEEALRSLLEARAVESGEAASERALTSIGVPDSVADVILRRLGRVARPTREVLSAAAVIGREIDIKI
ncbi:MAG TPA: AAA family ATPase, partial [Solirubrobacteraceae bacterium]|nr:AAA family ATPase [Solirubrobacteraceae bacterium]